jgi:hypothetical protein
MAFPIPLVPPVTTAVEPGGKCHNDGEEESVARSSNGHETETNKIKINVFEIIGIVDE